MATNPDFVVSEMTSADFTVTANSTTFDLSVGSNKFPSLFVGGEEEVELEFTGDAKVQIVYRSGSL